MCFATSQRPTHCLADSLKAFSFGCVFQQNWLSWDIAYLVRCTKIRGKENMPCEKWKSGVCSCKCVESCIDLERSITRECQKGSEAQRSTLGFVLKAEKVQRNLAWLSRGLKPGMLTYTRYILQFTAACGFEYSAGRTTDTEDSLGRFGKNSSHILYGPVRVNKGKWEDTHEGGWCRSREAKGAEVSPDCWTFRWWHETHGGSFVTVSASYPPGRSGGGGNESKQSECPTEASHTCSTPFSVLRHSHHHAISIKIQDFCYNLTIRLRDFTLSILIEGLNCKRIQLQLWDLAHLSCQSPIYSVFQSGLEISLDSLDSINSQLLLQNN